MRLEALLEHCDVELCRRAVEAHRDIVVGVKARMSTPTVGRNGLEPLRRALRAADETNMPLMVHIGAGPPDCGRPSAMCWPGAAFPVRNGAKNRHLTTSSIGGFVHRSIEGVARTAE